MDNEITVQEEIESAAAEIPADAVEESETEPAPGEGSPGRGASAASRRDNGTQAETCAADRRRGSGEALRGS